MCAQPPTMDWDTSCMSKGRLCQVLWSLSAVAAPAEAEPRMEDAGCRA